MSCSSFSVKYIWSSSFIFSAVIMEWLDTQMKKYNLMNRLLFVQNKINPLLWLYLIRDSSDKADNDARSTNNFVLVCASPSQSDIFGEYFVESFEFLQVVWTCNSSLQVEIIFISIGVMINISK